MYVNAKVFTKQNLNEIFADGILRVLVVGLGNRSLPGTRHNLGADMVQGLFPKASVLMDNLMIYEETIWSKRVVFILYTCPDSMNVSGGKIKLAYDKFRCHNLIIMLDDMETHIGKVKVSNIRGHNGHNGMKSILAHIPTHITRFKLGIGRPPEGMEVTDFVLGHFTNTEKKLFQHMLETIRELLYAWVETA